VQQPPSYFCGENLNFWEVVDYVSNFKLLKEESYFIDLERPYDTMPEFESVTRKLTDEQGQAAKEDFQKESFFIRYRSINLSACSGTDRQTINPVIDIHPGKVLSYWKRDELCVKETKSHDERVRNRVR
jgi:hypothetical protein